MKQYISYILKFLAHVYFIYYVIKEGSLISIHTSYLNTGQSMGVESTLLMIWSFFFYYIMALIIYGFGKIIENIEIEDFSTHKHKSFYEKGHWNDPKIFAFSWVDGLTKKEFDVK